MIFKKISFNGGKTFFIAPSWNQLGLLCFKLGRLINSSSKKYDRLIVIAKGGLTWARVLADYLNIPEIDSVKVRLYRGINKTFKKSKLLQGIKADISGEEILLFDDVVDSGQTVQFVKKFLYKQGAKRIDTAALFYKPSSKVRPDFFDHQTEAWIVFPHEIREFIQETRKDWLEKGVSRKSITERYIRLGIPEDHVKYFLDHFGP